MSSPQGHWILISGYSRPTQRYSISGCGNDPNLLSVHPTSSGRYHVAEAGYLRKRGASRKDFAYLIEAHHKDPAYVQLGPQGGYLCHVGLLTVHTWQLINTCPTLLLIRTRYKFARVPWQDNYVRDKALRLI